MIKNPLERNIGLFFTAALLVGLFLPIDNVNAGLILTILLIFLLYFSFLKVDLGFVTAEVKKPFRLVIQTFLNFMLVPAILFIILAQFNLPDYAVAALLLGSMPAGLASPVLTNLAGGRIATSVVVTIFSHIVAPLSIPFLFWAVAGLEVNVDVLNLGKQIIIILGIPVVLVFLTKKLAPKVVSLTEDYHKLASVITLAGIAYFAIAPYAASIKEDPIRIIPYLLASYLFFLIFFITSILFAANRSTKEKTALVVSRVYMNAALAIVLAFQFFNQEVILLTILAEIPWFTTFGAYMWLQKKVV